MQLIIRPIEFKDNKKMADIICTVLAEFGCEGPGWASSDTELENLFKAYQRPNSQYFVVEDIQSNQLLGGGGFAPLKESAQQICELQKLYLLAQARGTGMGKQLLEKIMIDAKKMGYQEMYLETSPELNAAVKMYEKLGFKMRKSNLGNTRHQFNCSIFMLKQL